MAFPGHQRRGHGQAHVIKLAVDDQRPRRFSGPARVYGSRDLALEWLRRGEIKAREVFSEAFTGGPLGLVRDGDEITIDLDQNALDLSVDPAELARRRAAFTPPGPSGERGWLGGCERTVGDLPRRRDPGS